MSRDSSSIPVLVPNKLGAVLLDPGLDDPLPPLVELEPFAPALASRASTSRLTALPLAFPPLEHHRHIHPIQYSIFNIRHSIQESTIISTTHPNTDYAPAAIAEEEETHPPIVLDRLPISQHLFFQISKHAFRIGVKPTLVLRVGEANDS